MAEKAPPPSIDARSSGNEPGEEEGRAPRGPRTRTVRLLKGLPLKKLVQAIHFHARAEDVHGYALGFYLRDLDVRRDEKRMGYASAAEFAAKNVGRTSRKASESVRIEALLEELPRIRETFAKGEISFSKVRAIVRVATEATEEAWLEAARSKTSNELERMVKGKKKGQKPSDKLGTRRTTCRIQYDVPASVKAAWDTLIQKAMDELGEGATPVEALKLIAERGLMAEGEGSPYAVVFHVAPDGQSAWADFDEGRVPIGVDEAFEAARSGRALELRDPLEGEYPAILFGERGTVPEGERDDPTSPALRQAVLMRDGHRCLLCGSKENPGVHHFRARANGGRTVIEGLGTFCGNHNSIIHEGFVDLVVGSKGRVYAKDENGRDIALAVPAAEALRDAGAEHPLTLVEVVPATLVEVISAYARNGNDSQESSRASQVVTASRSPSADDARDGGGDLDAFAGVSADAAGDTAVRAGEGSPGRPDDSQESSGASQVVTASHSPLEDDALRAVRLAESLDELPQVIGPAAWHALSGRLEWVRSEGGLVFHPEWEGAPPRRERGGHPVSRAPRLTDLVGQERAIRILETAVWAARMRREPLPHVLLEGPPGVGKTTIARALAREMGAGIHVIEGGVVEDLKKVAALLTGLGKGDILFIDEIHALPTSVAECFYPALEEGVFHTQVRSRSSSSRLLEVTLEPFTLVGATTEEGKLPEPLRSRFRLDLSLERYTLDALETIVLGEAERLGLRATTEASRAIARRARGTPRGALRLVAWARDHAQVAGLCSIEQESVERAMEAFGIDDEGLDDVDRRILALLLERRRPMGIDTIAATLGMDSKTIRRVHESYLLERGYVVRTSRGREATEKARRLMAG